MKILARAFLKKRDAFTLIELIFVCGIIALLVTLAIPVFTQINRGANMKAAERQILGGTFLARQHAVNTRQQVMFAVPYYVYTTSGTPQNNYVRPNMLYRSFLCIGRVTSGVAKPENIVGKVEALPPGIAFDKDSVNDFGVEHVVTDSETGKPIFKVKGFRFSPGGGVAWPDVDAKTGKKNGFFELKLIEGALPAGTTNSPPVAKANSPYNTADIKIQIAVGSGRCQIVEGTKDIKY